VSDRAKPQCICSKFTREHGLITRTCPEHDPLSDEQTDALRRHGYNPDYPPRGSGGAADSNYKTLDGGWTRPRVCFLDGIEIEGHEPSDLDPLGPCIHCGEETFIESEPTGP
jgi:hypothetical protein